jgi:hypothetical protein
MWIISFAMVIFGAMGVNYWQERVESWGVSNYPDDSEYMCCLLIGWVSVMMGSVGALSMIIMAMPTIMRIIKIFGA